MIYFDTSYLTKLYVLEPGTSEIDSWLQGNGGLVCSLHGRLELTASFKRH
jgi:hypothetical protein